MAAPLYREWMTALDLRHHKADYGYDGGMMGRFPISKPDSLPGS
jgi:hypothetical protein